MGDFNGSAQVHDFEPGIAESGLFWTVPIADNVTWANPGRGRARYRWHDMAVPDYHDFFNAVGLASLPVPTVASHVSFDVRWSGGGQVSTIHDDTFGFEGRFVDGPVSIEFTASQDGSGITYVSDPDDQIIVSGGVGHERNGMFFR